RHLHLPLLAAQLFQASFTLCDCLSSSSYHVAAAMICRRTLFRALRAAPCLRQTRAFTNFPPSFPPSASSPPVGNIPLPYITEVSSNGWRTYDIFSKLLQERIVCLNGAIDDTVSASIVAQLLWLESDSPDKAITMYINSPGGSVSAGRRIPSPANRTTLTEIGLAIYDTMAYIKSPVSTVCLGAASSMAALLLTGGEAGKRYALPHSSVMIHQPLGGTQGQASDILIYANQIQRIRRQINEIMRRHINTSFGRDRFSLEEVHDMMERDKYLSAEEAKEIGVIDEILTRREDKDEKEKGAAEEQKTKP
ncbi:ATP-dependent clp protease proteolytic subunit, partial [Colletotrichum musicola]